MSNMVLKNVSKKYGKNEVLKNININISLGKVIGLLGLNGAGKTTLLNILAGLESYNGEITPIKRNDIAYMSCANYYFNDMRVKDIINFNFDFYKAFNKAGAEEKLLSMNYNLKQFCNNLSSGQLRFLNFVLTIHRNSTFYLLDEPLTNMDIIYRDELITSLISAFSDQKTFIISSHELACLEPLFTHITILDNGNNSDLYDVEEIRMTKSLDEFYKEAVSCEK